ncbi:hypothetical protein I4300191C4_03160 [Solibaculum mannosilyticum]
MTPPPEKKNISSSGIISHRGKQSKNIFSILGENSNIAQEKKPSFVNKTMEEVKNRGNKRKNTPD